MGFYNLHSNENVAIGIMWVALILLKKLNVSQGNSVQSYIGLFFVT